MVVAIVASAMLIRPPFYVALEHGTVSSCGYAWIFSPPDCNLRGLSPLVNVPLLLTQWVAVGIVGAVAWLLLADRK